ncbi:MAG: UDP-N-acetylmuramate dehydrogenase [Actinomycetota bacterium]|jgi:UDP-N-acetylmuramate dehydrogenase|nr:UDP-N-acetylmuramate dehydrogenase [Actinomycetota bacterium]
MTFAEVAERLRTSTHARVETEFNLARYTTYRLGGPAALYVEPVAAADLQLLGEALREGDPGAPPSILILGRGSNLVISDQGFPGVVIRMGAAFAWLKSAGPTGFVTGASSTLPQLANWAARRSLTGMEFTISIPGSVGGAVRMNAGAHGSEISDRLSSITVFDLDGLELRQPSASSLGFAYRRSELTEKDLVIDATFQLEPGDPASIRERMDGYRKHRSDTQPGAAQNAGSVFKNPPGGSAGHLVEAAGLKGFRIGGAAVSELHANFFMAGEGATAQDIYDLVQEVRRRVRDSSGVELEPEIRFVGPFEDRAAEALQ